MESFREHIRPFHHKIVYIKVTKMGEINANAVIWISRRTDGQHDVREEIVVPVGGVSS
jgi:hypothetical protein